MCALLAVAAVVNVGVAWGIEWRLGSEESYSDYVQRALNTLQRQMAPRNPPGSDETFGSVGVPGGRVFEGLPKTIEVSTFHQGRARRPFHSKSPFGWSSVYAERRTPEGTLEGSWFSALGADVGWPMHSMRGVQWTMHDMSKRSNSRQIVLTRRWDTGLDRDGRPVILPLQPLWLGFAVNTLVYSASLFIGWIAIVAVRRALRRRRGLCFGCGYDVTAVAQCPECGRMVHVSRST
ncbi:MAG: hypothetical protein AAFX05_12215 [Planctomycetota bacterium]